jgi:hypothetical protein
VACARSSVYATRLESAKVLLVKEREAAQVEYVVSQSANKDGTSGSQLLWRIEADKAEKQDCEARTEEVSEHTRILREELEQARMDISERRAHLANRKADLEAINARLPSQRKQKETKIGETTTRGSHSFEALNDRSVETRAFLCREAAILLGLKYRKRRKGDKIVDQYYLAGLPIFDLREGYSMISPNSIVFTSMLITFAPDARCAELNVVVASVAHLLILVSFYLSVRLPNEITLPHRGSPLPTILKAENSYTAREQAFSNRTAAKSSTSSPSTSRHDEVQGTARPRPLSVGSGEKDERIAHVFENETAAFALFLEGYSLLALNVAWLCRSQGLRSGTETEDDISNIGKNLWQLLLAPPQNLPENREPANGRLKSHKKSSRKSFGTATPELRLGQGSQASAHSFLGAPGSLERDYRLPPLVLITDRLKSAIYADIRDSEWEVFHEDEWDDGTEQFDEAVHIKTRAMNGNDFDDARSIMTTQTRAGDDDRATPTPSEAGESVKSAKTAGTSGWTRVKSREK